MPIADAVTPGKHRQGDIAVRALRGCCLHTRRSSAARCHHRCSPAPATRAMPSKHKHARAACTCAYGLLPQSLMLLFIDLAINTDHLQDPAYTGPMGTGATAADTGMAGTGTAYEGSRGAGTGATGMAGTERSEMGRAEMAEGRHAMGAGATRAGMGEVGANVAQSLMSGSWLQPRSNGVQ